MINMSSHGLWLLTVAKCGFLCVRDIFSLVNFKKNISSGDGRVLEVAQWLKTFVALAEDPGSVSNTRSVAYNQF